MKLEIYPEKYHKVVIQIPNTNYVTYCHIRYFGSDTQDEDLWINQALRLSFSTLGTPRQLIINGILRKVSIKMSGGAMVERLDDLWKKK